MKILKLLLVCCLFNACANPVSPTGGNKDVLQPIITSIQIDSLPIPKTITIQFNEYIKTSNDIVLNPQRKIEKKTIITTSLKGIQFSIPTYSRSINLTNSIRDLNENNLGKYPMIHLSTDTLQFNRSINLNEFFKNQVKQFRLEKRIDTFYYRSYNIADTIYISGLPNNTTNLTAYLDANTNNTYDSTEWYKTTSLDSNENLHLFPPIINKIEVDTSNFLTVAIIPFYFIQANLERDSQILIKKDTVIFTKAGFNLWHSSNNYSLLYKKIPLKNYLIKRTQIFDGDTTVKYLPSLGSIINPTKLTTDTIRETVLLGKITFDTDTLLRNTKLILLNNGKYHRHIDIILRTQSVIIPVGNYTIITYIDRNESKLFDAHKLSDSIIHYFEKIHVKPKLEHVIKLNKPTHNTSPTSGKNNPLIPISINRKKGVDQTNTTIK